MIAVRIGPDIRLAVVGAPSYFAGYGDPRTPREFSAHRCINYRHVKSGGLYAWDFEEKGRPFEVRVEGSLVFNNVDLIREAALAGQGLVYTYEDIVADDIKAGRLTRILEKWCPTFPGYYLYHPHGGSRLPRWLRSLQRCATSLSRATTLPVWRKPLRGHALGCGPRGHVSSRPSSNSFIRHIGPIKKRRLINACHAI